MYGCNSVMKRMTREISSRLYIFLPYLSFNLGKLPDTLEDTHRGGWWGNWKTGPSCCEISDAELWSSARVSRLAGATLPPKPGVFLLTCRLTCRLPIDQIFKLPFLFLNFRWKHFVILFPYCFDHELWEQDSILLKPGRLLTEGKVLKQNLCRWET